eukprot:gnl/MRDRNA2_/MRDRNA2_67341_c0_seq1.p1 gnl/MRDRNA2_/MRDRNA2_67341_c0~~gnl/MRDRNA2_/MRDRNA2_67341_c0_seq1.p1  ORF type:complete len:134 (-),score=18.61 gnl/MRDRNA2_/MRDRNA2_67341_c0_seq1:161-562(-)
MARFTSHLAMQLRCYVLILKFRMILNDEIVVKKKWKSNCRQIGIASVETMNVEVHTETVQLLWHPLSFCTALHRSKAIMCSTLSRTVYGLRKELTMRCELCNLNGNTKGWVVGSKLGFGLAQRGVDYFGSYAF